MRYLKFISVVCFLLISLFAVSSSARVVKNDGFRVSPQVLQRWHAMPMYKGLQDKVKAIATSDGDGSDKRICVVRKSGHVFCWGSNDHGELGNGVVVDSAVPVQVLGRNGQGYLSAVKSVASGEDFTCALMDVGAVACWGRNDRGQLGANLPPPDSHFPVQVVDEAGTPLVNVTQIATSRNLACALKDEGTVWCWGSLIGWPPTPKDVLAAHQISEEPSGNYLTNIEQIEGGFHTMCGVKSDHTLWCWKRRLFLGGESESAAHIPLNFSVASVSVGLMRICVVEEGNGNVWCWGDRPLGNGTINDSTAPVRVVGVNGSGYLTDVVSVAVGRSHACAVVDNSTREVVCWGDQRAGALGNGVNSNQWDDFVVHPVAVLGPNGVGQLNNGVLLDAQYEQTCVARGSAQLNRVYCWGAWEATPTGIPPLP